MERRDIADRDGSARLANERPPLDRFDALLAVIPATFVLAILAAAALDVPLEATVAGASLVGALAVLDGLFFRPSNGLRGT